jgi:hypothetical protein
MPMIVIACDFIVHFRMASNACNSKSFITLNYGLAITEIYFESIVRIYAKIWLFLLHLHGRPADSLHQVNGKE